MTLTAERGERSGTRRTISRSIRAATTAEKSMAPGMASHSGQGVPGSHLAASAVPARSGVAAVLSTNET